MKFTKNPLNFMDALCVLFIGLKLTNVIDWSWFWVFTPEWIELIAAVIIVWVAKTR